MCSLLILRIANFVHYSREYDYAEVGTAHPNPPVLSVARSLTRDSGEFPVPSIAALPNLPTIPQPVLLHSSVNVPEVGSSKGAGKINASGVPHPSTMTLSERLKKEVERASPCPKATSDALDEFHDLITMAQTLEESEALVLQGGQTIERWSPEDEEGAPVSPERSTPQTAIDGDRFKTSAWGTPPAVVDVEAAAERIGDLKFDFNFDVAEAAGRASVQPTHYFPSEN